MKCNVCGQEFGNGAYCQHCNADRITALGNYSGGYNAPKVMSKDTSTPSHSQVRRHNNDVRIQDSNDVNQETSRRVGVESSDKQFMVCYNCANVIPQDSEYCPFCGIKLFVSCPKCGHHHSSQYPICNKCGTNREEYLEEQRLIIAKEQAINQLKQKFAEVEKKKKAALREEETKKEVWKKLTGSVDGERIRISQFVDSHETLPSIIHMPQGVKSFLGFGTTEGDDFQPYIFGCSLIRPPKERSILDRLVKIELSNSLIEIGSYAFGGCSSLQNIVIPNSVTIIGDGAFCFTSLTNITIPNSLTKIGCCLFHSCRLLNDVTIPNTIISIGPNAFNACERLTSINIPNSVTEIKGYAFANCTSLTNITLPNSVTKMGSCVFQGCTSLTDISIPASITMISLSTFKGCIKLKNVTLPTNIETIKAAAFYDCKSLETIYIPNNVIEIGNNAFLGCDNLREVIIDRGSKIKFSKWFSSDLLIER